MAKKEDWLVEKIFISSRSSDRMKDAVELASAIRAAIKEQIGKPEWGEHMCVYQAKDIKKALGIS